MVTFKKLYYFFILQLILNSAGAQELYYKSMVWDPNPKPASSEKLDQTEGQIVLKDVKIVEYAYEKSGELISYVTKHKHVKVFSDKGIEYNNKVYIPTGGVIEFVDIKARAISPSGKISTIEKSAIKDMDNVDNKGSYKMFAVEGIEKNSEIEYTYTCKKSANRFGIEYIQSEVPHLNYEIKIISPKNLSYEGRLYNTKTAVKNDTLSDGRNIIDIKMENVEPLKDEKYSFISSNLIRFEYKLAYNTVRGKARLFTWDDAADRYYQMICVFEKKEINAVNSFLKKAKISGADDLAKVRNLENQIKLKYEIKDQAAEEYENIEKILVNKFADEVGITKLYMCCLNQMGIKAELVLACDRTNKKFDPDFDTWNYLEEFLIFIPSCNSYLSPKDIFSRVGFPPPNLTGQKGLFVKEIDMGQGDVKSGIAKIKTISSLDYTASSNVLDVNVSFSEDLTQSTIKTKHTNTGYEAYYSQPVIGFMSDLQKKEFQEQTLKTVGDDSKMEDVKMSGLAENEILVAPFVMECVLKSPSMLEKAGNKYLFKAGLLIGPQAEMYQEGNRKTPPQISFAHMYKRKLVINVPVGYKLVNAEKLNMDQKLMNEDKVLAQFVSTYTLSGNTIEVNVIEDYRVLDYPLEKFEDYRKVINAAADFNKIQLVFEKL